MIFHPPLYPYFLAVPLALIGDALGGASGSRSLVCALLVPAVGPWARGPSAPRVGLLAAAHHRLLSRAGLVLRPTSGSETLFLVLLWWGFERLLAADARARTGARAGGGPVVGAGRSWRARRSSTSSRWPRSGSPGAAARRRPPARGRAFARLPGRWSSRPGPGGTGLVYRAFVPVSTAGGLNLFQGNAPLSRQEVYDESTRCRGRIEQYRYARRHGHRGDPRAAAGVAPREAARADADVLGSGEHGAHPHQARAPTARSRRRAAVAVGGGDARALPRAARRCSWSGWPRSRYRPRARCCSLGFLVYYNLIHVVTHGFNRYRLPVMPVVFLFAAARMRGLARGVLSRRCRGRRGAGRRARAGPARSAWSRASAHMRPSRLRLRRTPARPPRRRPRRERALRSCRWPCCSAVVVRVPFWARRCARRWTATPRSSA